MATWVIFRSNGTISDAVDHTQVVKFWRNQRLRLTLPSKMVALQIGE